jgi:hypothetical protein
MSPSDRLSLLVLNAIDAVGVVVIVLVALTFLFLAWGYVMGSIIPACEWLGRQSRAWRTLYEGMLIIALCAVAYLVVGCTSARFTPPPAATIRSPEPIRPQAREPFTREREDREFGRPEDNGPPTPQGFLALPPEKYDRPYEGQLTIARGDARTMQAVCPKTAFPITLGCAIRYTKDGKDYSCTIYIAEDDILKPTGWTYKLILRHERAHCGGWPANHPGMQAMPAA